MSGFKGRTLRPASLRQASKHQATTAGLGVAVGLSAMMMMPAQALAQEPEQLATVKVQDTAIDANPNAEPGVPYKAKVSGDERHTRPLAETPLTINVLTKAQIDDSGYTDLTRILDAQPGITLGTGENGNAFGDRYVIRGQEAKSDTFVDGLRDPGMTIRESFAIEQLEITKGPNSTFAGRGSSGGAINAITKQATPFLDFANLQGTIGTDDHLRLTADVNKVVSDSFAIRANALYAKEDVPDRAPAYRKREGAAISAYFTPTDAFEATLDYYGMRAKDNPDVGGYLVAGKPAPNVPSYVQQEDFLESDVNTFTARLKYRFSDNVRLTSLTRYGSADNGYVISGGRSGTTGANNPGGVYPTTTLSAHQGWQEVRYFANQENLFVNTNLFGLDHELIFSLEYTDNAVKNGVYGVTNTGAFNCITGTGTTLNNFCLTGANGALVPGGNSLLKRSIVKGTWDTDWQIKTISASVMDTVDLTDKLTVFAGLRYDTFDFTLDVQNTTTLVKASYPYSDDLWNGHLGVTYKLSDGVIVYATYASAADINGGESDVGTSSGYGGVVIYNGSIAGAKPERSQSFEVGAKWNVFDETLLLTGSVFQVTKSDVMEGANYDTIGTFNSGKNRVTGFEVGATGALTDKLTVQAGATYMESEVLESATPANVGKMLANFAKSSGVVQLKYQATDSFYFGGAVKYEDKRYGGQPDTAAPFDAITGAYTRPVPSYTVLDLFASYRVNPNFEVRLNVSNVTDEEYYLAVYRGGFFLYQGDARATRLTLNYDF
ncbi:TonB-dependent siderophore receptor [Phenylobacterium sp.]|uniref:TonB-dependent receptor n=1 Tax=Phenylobacterium sp. TaxID=1871053 RepID=UPI00271EF971|nr:TonB-dependent receptor [Phenylobacterium sp.]MDO8802317.1 TonB-dependent receptor [Phenylobacterium sp.]